MSGLSPATLHISLRKPYATRFFLLGLFFASLLAGYLFIFSNIFQLSGLCAASCLGVAVIQLIDFLTAFLEFGNGPNSFLQGAH